MPMEIKKDTFSFCKLFTESKCEQTVNFEINLPDYCSDIKRILRCIVTAGISNVSLSGENVSLTGSVTARVIYVGENEKIDCCEHIAPLSCNTRIGDMPENPTLRAFAKTDYVNCRALSQRRVSVSGSVGASVYVFCEEKRELPCQIEAEGIQCKSVKKKVTDLICLSEKTFDLSETVALDTEKADIGKLLRNDCRVTVESKKAVADKLLIKGQLLCEILYTDSEKGDIVKICHAMPISQILSVAGITDKCDIRLSLNSTQLAVSAKNDSSGRCRLLEIAARVSALIRCAQDREISLIEDCYSTKNEIEGEYKRACFYLTALRTEKEIPFEETVLLSDGNVKEIKDMWCSDTACILKGEASALQGNCDFLLHGIYTDEKGALRYTEKNISLPVTVPLKDKAENIKAECEALISALSFSPSAEGKIIIKGSLNLVCYAFECEEKQFLYEIKQGEKEKATRYPALCLYYADKGESIWDIAKHYGTTEALIRAENDIIGDKTDKERVIMVPCL